MDLVRKLREDRGWSQEQLAGAAEVGKRTIQRIEAGVTQLRPETALALAQALGVPAADLIRYSGLRAYLRTVVIKWHREPPTAAEIAGLPPDLRPLFAAYYEVLAEIDAAKEAVERISAESDVLHDKAMAILTANAEAWTAIFGSGHPATSLRLLAEMQGRLEILKRNSEQRDKVLLDLHETTEHIATKTSEAMAMASRLDRVLDGYGVFS